LNKERAVAQVTDHDEGQMTSEGPWIAGGHQDDRARLPDVECGVGLALRDDLPVNGADRLSYAPELVIGLRQDHDIAAVDIGRQLGAQRRAKNVLAVLKGLDARVGADPLLEL